WFERAGQGFIPPNTWDRGALAMTSTHDLPTVAGWWAGGDIATRTACGKLSLREEDALAERAAERSALWRAFEQAHVAAGSPPPPDDPQPVVDAALAFIAETQSPLCLPPIEDLLGLEEQPNLPGTIDEHPNWRRRLKPEASTLLDQPSTAARIQHLEKQRPRL
ncbi:MAG TPA: 4-alpha-glucanotransferase, partial [Ktedonobacterales bacterium]|nr:4-alpha-glucanotransferase [Ktedonobacterales bacterium]